MEKAKSGNKIVVLVSDIKIKMLLTCGILSSLLYVIMNIVVPTKWEEYDPISQTVSELSAVGAPTRMIWILPGIIYSLLVIAFGIGVGQSGRLNQNLVITGKLLIIYGVLSLGWPLAPMHLRETLAAGGATVSDTMHIALTILTVIIMIGAMGSGSLTLGKNFRYYSFMTIIALAAFGSLTAMEAQDVNKNLPTPLIGVWERINIGVFLLWMVVFSIGIMSFSVSSPISIFQTRTQR